MKKRALVTTSRIPHERESFGLRSTPFIFPDVSLPMRDVGMLVHHVKIIFPKEATPEVILFAKTFPIVETIDEK